MESLSHSGAGAGPNYSAAVHYKVFEPKTRQWDVPREQPTVPPGTYDAEVHKGDVLIFWGASREQVEKGYGIKVKGKLVGTYE